MSHPREHDVQAGDPVVYVDPGGKEHNAIVNVVRDLPVSHCIHCKAIPEQVQQNKPCTKDRIADGESHDVQTVHDEPLVTLSFNVGSEIEKRYDLKHHSHPGFDETNGGPRITVNCWKEKGETHGHVPVGHAHHVAHHGRPVLTHEAVAMLNEQAAARSEDKPETPEPGVLAQLDAAGPAPDALNPEGGQSSGEAAADGA